MLAATAGLANDGDSNYMDQGRDAQGPAATVWRARSLRAQAFQRPGAPQLRSRASKASSVRPVSPLQTILLHSGDLLAHWRACLAAWTQQMLNACSHL